MYSIYADDTLIYSPSVAQMCLYDIVLNMEDNSAGTLNFYITSGHPAFLGLKKLASLITVKDGGAVLWKGRIIADGQDINNIKQIQCEGKLAFLNDSIFPEFEFSGSPERLFTEIMQNHNRHVSDRQKLLPGKVTVRDSNDYIVRSSDRAAKTWQALKEKCFQSSLGGHLRIRYEPDGDYLDWLEDYTEISGQPITFGKNIIDLLVNTSAAGTYTAIRPLGAVINAAAGDEADGTEYGKAARMGSRIDIKTVNGGQEYLVNEEKASEYGIIYADPDDSIWEDVTLPKNLLRKAEQKLASGITLKKTIDVRAVDLNLTNSEIEALKVCTYVQVISPLHGIAEYYLLSKAEIHIDSPERTQYTLGAVKATLTDTGKAQVANVIQAVGAAIPSAVSQLKNDKEYVTKNNVLEVIEESAVSPSIEISEQSEDAYRLRIVSAGGEIITPNLIGPSGPSGESAYETAVRNGFSGTETEWLETLKGENSGAAGLFCFECDEQGNLWMYYNDRPVSGCFELDSSGNIYYVIPEDGGE